MSSAPGAVLFTSNNTERDSHLLLQIRGKLMLDYLMSFKKKEPKQHLLKNLFPSGIIFFYICHEKNPAKLLRIFWVP